jgi:uncharacterized YccA/Bax inhibitor family protein
VRTSNPAFASETIYADWAAADRRGAVMTVQGTALKTLLLLLILTATAGWSWSQASLGAINGPLVLGSAVVGFVVALLTIFRPTLAPYTSPLYAAAEGVFLGAFSNLINQRYPGIAVQAVGLTLATLFCMLVVYGTGLVRVTDRLRTGIIAATGAVALVYLVTLVLGLFGARVPYIHDAGPIGIAFSLFVVGLAAFNLLLDFDFIERGARGEAPKYLEWYGAFGLMVTLIWLYLEILRLLRKIQDRR